MIDEIPVSSYNKKEKDYSTMNRSDVTIREMSIRGIKEKTKSSSWQMLGIAGQLGFDIAIPIVLGALIGNALDQAFHTYPTWTMILLGLGVLISIVNFIRFVGDILKRKDL